MLSYILFMRALLAHEDRLQVLLGDLWPTFQARLEALLNEMISEPNKEALPARVNRIYRCFERTPAEPLVRALLQQAVEQVQKLEPQAWSMDIRDPITLQTRSVDLRTAALPPGAPLKGVTATAEELKAIAVEFAQAVARPAEEMEKHVNVWISERMAEPTRPLVIGEHYTLNLGVGKKVAESLLRTKKTRIPSRDLKGRGLETEWVVSSSEFELSSNDPELVVSAEGPKLWKATFSLLIPEQGDSKVRQLSIVPRSLESSRLNVTIFAVGVRGRELYRRFSIKVPAEGAGKTGVRVSTTGVQGELVFAPSFQMNLKTTHEWTTPLGGSG